MKFTEWIRHRIVGRFQEPDYRELQEIAQKAKRLAGVYINDIPSLLNV